MDNRCLQAGESVMRFYLMVLILFGSSGCGFYEQETDGDTSQGRPGHTSKLVNSIGMELIKIPAGSFSTETGYANPKASPKATYSHTITLS